MKKEGIQTRNRKLSSKSKKKKGLGGACLPIGSHLGVGVGMSDLMKPLDPSKTFGGGFSASMGMYEIFFASNRFPRSFAKRYSFYIFFTLTEHKSIWSPRFLYSYWLRFLTTPAIYVLMICFIFFSSSRCFPFLDVWSFPTVFGKRLPPFNRSTWTSFQWTASSSCAYARRMVYKWNGSVERFQWITGWFLDSRLIRWRCSASFTIVSLRTRINGKFRFT